ncbi:hypothetical protein Ddye_017843 [Dipteronia dyeriana]|uniref:Uncharacterized protein n=1 Tax=Dipteronia dyeriana TaxID=168575 RepID=A0AAD9X072_9ROSI|nr:hypothetical protein Ddye_017843 [Dipteronia dyeriana]
MQFSSGVVHWLLLHKIHHYGPTDKMRFMLGKYSIQFFRVEFCLITGLKFGVILDMTLYEDVENGIDQTRVEYGQWQEKFNTVKLCLLLMLNCILIGLGERGFIPNWQLCLVDDLDAFSAFLWDSHAYKYSIYGFKRALHSQKKRYNLYGFTYALLVFALEVIPALAM